PRADEAPHGQEVIMSTRQPWITGAAFAVTAALLNIACALAVLFYPDAVLQLANSWAHGIDFTIIRRSPDNALAFYDWAAGFVTSAIFAFLVGAVYRWSLNLISRLGTSRGVHVGGSSHA
ncbi:MAG TPA: DUF5676 family membrane protein, partial [Burkholderiales bacterium]|nr:DUF5676 family membrane protein [Burkholderiales bacterium]